MDAFDFREIPAFGVAGNFTGHLEQAGEARDFVRVKAAAGSPKAVFPTYIPAAAPGVPAFLNTFPFDSEKIIFPAGEERLQIEPECALLCEARWSDGRLERLHPTHFAASNDCSIRKDGARKISEKKNWGAASKGLSQHLIAIDRFEKTGILGRYRIASFLLRDGTLFAYGEDSPVSGYSYMYQTLTDWLIEKCNAQADEGPAEDVHSYLASCGFPQRLLFSVGATRYTRFGETNFLRGGDISAVLLYPEDEFSPERILRLAQDVLSGRAQFPRTVSALVQNIQL